MDAGKRARLEACARVVKAMAHPTRLFIVDELSRKERCVCELAEMVGADVSTVSRHISVLRSAGIVEDEKCGSEVRCRLRCPCVLDFFQCVETVMKTTAAKQRRLARKR